jgi:coenzyme F420-reducing hydrogenase beta subunit
MVFEVELELRINEEDGSIVFQKMSELVNKARELGFVIVEAEQEEKDKDEEESNKHEKRNKRKKTRTRKKVTNMRKRRNNEYIPTQLLCPSYPDYEI